MTNEEFSNEFDVLINSNAISKPFDAGDSLFEFNEYEKSVFLTKAQETIIRQLYNGTLTGVSFEETQELRRYLSTLIKTKEATCTNNNDGTYDFHVKFEVDEDDLCCLSGAIDRCVLEKGEENND